MRRTVTLSLATLGVATIATAAVMTSTPDADVQRARVTTTATSETHHMRPAVSESEAPTTTKRECRRSCWFSFD